MYIVISGGGKIGSYLGQVLSQNGHDVAIIEESPENIRRLTSSVPRNVLLIQGNGCDSKFQEDAGIRHADMFVATMGHDDDNLVACEIARRVFSVARCISRVNSPKNLRIFHELGIECVSSTTIIAELIEEETRLGSSGASLALSQGNIVLAELLMPTLHYQTNDYGVLAQSIPMPYNSTLVAVNSSGVTQVVNENTVIRSGDKVIIAAVESVVPEVRALFDTL